MKEVKSPKEAVGLLLSALYLLVLVVFNLIVSPLLLSDSR